jgi:hypothetical protein
LKTIPFGDLGNLPPDPGRLAKPYCEICASCTKWHEIRFLL